MVSGCVGYQHVNTASLFIMLPVAALEAVLSDRFGGKLPLYVATAGMPVALVSFVAALGLADTAGRRPEEA